MKNNNLMFIYSILTTFIFLFAENNSCLSQQDWTPKNAFDLKNSGELYDERGYSKSNPIKDEDKLHISTNNGTVMYSYPISNYQVNGTPINISLNYCGDVSFSSYSGFDNSNNSWKKFTQNRPVWIMGLNGFAVQVFSYNSMLINRPDIYNVVDYPANTQFNDSHLNWSIDGYDFCGRFFNFYPSVQGFRDVIKILRSDGSVLELRNSRETFSGQDYLDTLFYEGTYFENSVNSRGIGIVKFIDDNNLHGDVGSEYNTGVYRPRILRYFPGDGMEYIFQEYLLPYGPNFFNDFSGIPEDGTWLNTYRQQNLTFGGTSIGHLACPSIFYLLAVRNKNQQVTSCVYSRHVTYPDEDPSAGQVNDVSSGRALLRNIDDNNFVIGGSAMKSFCGITARGKQIVVNFGENFPGNTDIVNFVQVAGRGRSESELYNLRIDRFDKRDGLASQCKGYSLKGDYYSFVPYVTSITETIDDLTQDEKVTIFDYEKYNTEYHYVPELAFPRSNIPDENEENDILKLYNYRLTQIKEPTNRFKLSYFDETTIYNLPYSSNTIEIDGQIYKSESNYHLFHNVVHKLEKFKRNSYIENLTTEHTLDEPEPNLCIRIDEYGFDSRYGEGYSYLANSPSTCILISKSIESGVVKNVIKKEYLYSAFILPPIHNSYEITSHSPTFLIHTNLYKTIETNYIGNTNTIENEITTWNAVGCPNNHVHDINDASTCPYKTIIVPLCNKVAIKDNNNDNEYYTKDYLTYEYEYDYSFNDVYYDYHYIPFRIFSEYDSEFPINNILKWGMTKRITTKWIDGESLIPGGFEPTNHDEPPNGKKYSKVIDQFYQLDLIDHESIEPWLIFYSDYSKTYQDFLEQKFYDDPEVANLTFSDYYRDHSIKRELLQSKLVYSPSQYDILIKSTSWKCDESGDIFLLGKSSDIQKEFFDLEYKSYRGSPVEEKLLLDDIGNDIITSTYEYINLFNKKGLGQVSEVKNANNAETQFCYRWFDLDQVFYDDWFLKDLEHSEGNRYFPYAKKYTNLDKVKKTSFFDNTGYLFGRLFAFNYSYKPEVVLTKIRKYGTDGTLNNYNSLMNIFSYDYFNNITQKVEPNGWLEYLTYDRIGRLTTLTQPFDFFDDPESEYYNIQPPTLSKFIMPGFGGSYESYTLNHDTCYRQKINGVVQNVKYGHWSNVITNELNDRLKLFSVIYDNNKNWCICGSNDYNSQLIDKKDSIEKIKENTPLSTIEYLCYQRSEYRSSFNSFCEIIFEKGNIEYVDDLTSVSLKFKVVDISPNFNNTLIFTFGNELIGVFSEEILITNSSDNSVEPNESFTITINNHDNLNILESLINQNALTIKIELTNKYINNSYIEFLNSPSVNKPKQITDISVPLLELEGNIILKTEKNNNEEFTLKYDYAFNNQQNNTSENGSDYITFKVNKTLKIDDKVHTNKAGSDYESSFIKSFFNQYQFGTNFRLLSSHINAENTNDYLTQNYYDGFGNKTKVWNRVLNNDPNQGQINEFKSKYDASGRLIENNFPNHTSVTETEPAHYNIFTKFNFYTGAPTTLKFNDFFFDDWLGLNDDNMLFGFATKKVTIHTDNTKNVQIFDAFDNLRADVYLNNLDVIKKATKYVYDELNRIKFVKNIKDLISEEQTVRYWYDNFGRVRYKYQPDRGLDSYAYDLVGNLRFSQSAEQAPLTGNQKLNFYEYDDLNRITIMGEAIIDEGSINPSRTRVEFDQINDLNNESLILNRLTDLDEAIIHKYSLNDGGQSAILTSNKTLWHQTPIGNYLEPNTIWPITNCLPNQYKTLNKMLGTNSKPNIPLVVHPAFFHQYVVQTSRIDDFENIGTRPYNVLRAYFYDELPSSLGTVWGKFPSLSKWDALCPPVDFNETGDILNPPENKVTNLKGRISAIAYREHGGQPFNYMVFSYDPRGRVNAFLRYTENLGFDAVYYTYNSLNQVLSVTVVDPAKNYTTWYDYDDKGRVSKVWTSTPSSPGLCGLPDNPTTWHNNAQIYVPPGSKPEINDIEFEYTSNGQLRKKIFPQLNIVNDMIYSRRGLLSHLTVKKDADLIFMQNLTYLDSDKSLISRNENLNGTSQHTFQYNYDALNQLINWNYLSDLYQRETFEYDPLGNRTLSQKLIEGFDSDYDYSDPYGKSRLTKLTVNKTLPPNDLEKECNFNYYNHGPLSTKATLKNITRDPELWGKTEEKFFYDANYLLERYTTNYNIGGGTDPDCFSFNENKRTEWRYWYNPMNEREQKRMYYSPNGESGGNVYPWTYYLLGGMNEQLAVYQGFEFTDPTYFISDNYVCLNPYPRSVFLYPVEYNTYGAGSTIDLSWRIDENGAWKKDFFIHDHLGNNRVVLRQNSSDYNILARYDYEPFGKRVNVTAGGNDRLSFIGKEKDLENSLGDFGVRKYDEDIGRFTSIDPLFEKYAGWTPYHYCGNNPVSFVDGNGLLPGDPFKTLMDAAHDFGKNYNIVSIAIDREISTSFYEYKDANGEKTFTYAIPNATERTASNPNYSEINDDSYVKVAEAHTHGPDAPDKLNPNSFSVPEDKDGKFISFLFTPNGTGRIFDPSKKSDKLIFGDITKDLGNEYLNNQRLINHPEKRPVPLLVTDPKYSPTFFLINSKTMEIIK